MSLMCLHVSLERAVRVLGEGGMEWRWGGAGVRLTQGLMSSKCQTNSDMLDCEINEVSSTLCCRRGVNVNVQHVEATRTVWDI